MVVDPRRTETAALADLHLPIRPGGDAFLLAALVHTLASEKRVAPGRLAAFTDGLAALVDAVQPFSPEAVAGRTGIDAETIRALARDFAAAPAAVAYGRVGTCTQEFGGLASWLVNALNVVTGNLDRPGGAMFPAPAVDVVAFADRIGQRGHFDKGRSRVRGLPEFGGEWPAAVLAEEIETPGEGQVRALVTSSGNPVLSTPNGARLDRALASLDFMVSIDLYLNETSRHAHLILPPTFALERSHYDLCSTRSPCATPRSSRSRSSPRPKGRATTGRSCSSSAPGSRERAARGASARGCGTARSRRSGPTASSRCSCASARAARASSRSGAA